MIDRIAPTCPMCNEIVPYPKSMDPNEAVERHIMSGTCVGLQGGEERKKAEAKRRRDIGEVCWKKSCGKVLIVKMKCEVSYKLFFTDATISLTHLRSLANMSFAQHIDIPRHTHALIKHHPLLPPPPGWETLKHRLHLDRQAKLRYLAFSLPPCSLLLAQRRQDRYHPSK